MAQPEYVPVPAADRVRPAERLPPAEPWKPDRPGEIEGLRPPTGKRFGTPGPDQGYALTLAARFEDRLALQPGEHRHDALAGAVAVALRRASLFGRAPVVYDLEVALTLFGYLGDPPAELVEFRVPLFRGAGHHYETQRAVADSVAESTLRLPPAQVSQHLHAGWRSLFVS